MIFTINGKQILMMPDTDGESCRGCVFLADDLCPGVSIKTRNELTGGHSCTRPTFDRDVIFVRDTPENRVKYVIRKVTDGKK